MFTGIIEAVRPVAAFQVRAGRGRLEIDLGALADGTRLGDSVAVDGACLTVSQLSGTVAAFDVASETLGKTTLGGLGPGSRVNCERSLRVGDRLGGHFVLGHVDGVGTIAKREDSPGQVTMSFHAAPPIAGMMVPKGSVAIDGISLTLVDVGRDGFSVALIPTTLAHTTLGSKGERDKVNVETDILGKWIKRLLSGGGHEADGGVTMETLRRAGFA
ncbi:MAG TPA: riboflavin synthase [Candidatus Brocadiia bacterium]|nr:riboflavin synthase [Candidatus Brocadiia bacterium]